MRVLLATPTRERPTDAYLDSLGPAAEAAKAAGFECSSVFEVGCPYISAARARMLGKGLKAGFDVFVFIDDDVSFRPEDLVTLLKAKGDVVAGTYRFKEDTERYMGVHFAGKNDKPLIRKDGCISADRVPAGFLKVTRKAVNRFKRAYPHLVTNKDNPPSVDLFNHGAFEGYWWGEDYMFSVNWRKLGGDIWLIPTLQLDHNGKDKVYKGNLHEFLLRSPGGVKAPKMADAESIANFVAERKEHA